MRAARFAMRTWCWFLTCLVLACSGLGAASADLRVVEAAKRDDRVELRRLIADGAPVTVATADGTTALHWAAYWDNQEGVRLLLQQGAKANAATDLGVTPLWNACETGNAGVVSQLLEAGADPNVPLESGETPLMVAARVGDAATVEQLLDRGARADVRERSRGQTALMWAAAQRQPAVTRLLLAHHADLRARTSTWTQRVKTTPEQGTGYIADVEFGGYTALLFAARNGDTESARLLLDAGADVNDTAPLGTSALVIAAHSGQTETARLLLARGAHANAMAAGYSALHVAIVRGDEPLVEALLAAGADPNARLLKSTPTRRASGDVYMAPAFVGATPLWLAARYSAPGIMRRLVSAGADPSFVHHLDYLTQSQGYTTIRVDEGNVTILMAAVEMGARILRAETDPGPDPKAQEPLVLECVKIASQLHQNLNAVNAEGNSALHAAAAKHYDSVVDFLIAQGANRELENQRGRTPLDERAAPARRRP